MSITFVLSVNGVATDLSNQDDYYLEWAGEILPLSAEDGVSRWYNSLVCLLDSRERACVRPK